MTKIRSPLFQCLFPLSLFQCLFPLFRCRLSLFRCLFPLFRCRCRLFPFRFPHQLLVDPTPEAFDTTVEQPGEYQPTHHYRTRR